MQTTPPSFQKKKMAERSVLLPLPQHFLCHFYFYLKAVNLAIYLNGRYE